MLFEILRHIKNFFTTDKSVEGALAIADGTISLPFALDGQYILIEGSVLNDGVYQYPLSGLKDETFNGRIVGLAIPSEFLKLVKDIEEYQEKRSKVPSGGVFQSESFGGYSYSLSTNSSGGVASWEDTFRNRLNVWRKI